MEFPIVRAGENHVYSKLELNTLTAIGQMDIDRYSSYIRIMENVIREKKF